MSRGGDEVDVEDAPLLQPTSRPKVDAATSQSVLNLVNCILGAGMLGYPYCFKSCGLLLATLVMLVALLACRVSYRLLLHSSQLSGRRTYESIAEQALGWAGRPLVEVCTAALNLGCVVAYLNILADVLSSVAGTLIPPGAEPSRGAYVIGVTLLGALPVGLLVRDHALVATLSAASVGFVMLFAAVILGIAIIPPPAPAPDAPPPPPPQPLLLWQPEGLLLSLPVMTYGFTAHPYYMGIYTTLPQPSVGRMHRVTDLAMLLSALVYWLVGLGGYAAYRGRTSGDVLRNLKGASWPSLRGICERSLKLCYGLSILGSIPLVILPFYSMLLPILGAEEGAPPPPPLTKPRSGDASGGSSGGRGSGGGSAPPGIGILGGSAAGTAPAAGGSGGGAPRPPLVSSSGSTGGGAAPPPTRPFAPPLLVPAGPAAAPTPPPAPTPMSVHTAPRVIDPHLTTASAELHPTVGQHCVVVLLVLGLSLASALWLPNVEFIFALTGATASSIIGFILPAICFIRIMATAPGLAPLPPPPPLNSAASAGPPAAAAAVPPLAPAAAASSSGSSAAVPAVKRLTLPPEIVARWECRRRLAYALLVFGLVSGVLCTRETLGGIQEEAAVVQLAVELMEREAVAADTAAAEMMAVEAAAAVSAVESAEQQLGEVQMETNATIGALEVAAAALSTIANTSDGTKQHIWDIQGRLHNKRQKAAEELALRAAGDAIQAVRQDVRHTMAEVGAVVTKLDADIQAIRRSAAAAAMAGGATNTSTPAPGAGGSSRRAGQLAGELGAALGIYRGVANNNASAGRSLEGVRASALSAFAALNTTSVVLDQVHHAVVAYTSHSKRRGDGVDAGSDALRDAAVAALKRALVASEASGLALRITHEALGAAATNVTSELLGALTRVAHNMERRSAGIRVVAAGSKGKGQAGGDDGGHVFVMVDGSVDAGSSRGAGTRLAPSSGAGGRPVNGSATGAGAGNTSVAGGGAGHGGGAGGKPGAAGAGDVAAVKEVIAKLTHVLSAKANATAAAAARNASASARAKTRAKAMAKAKASGATGAAAVASVGDDDDDGDDDDEGDGSGALVGAIREAVAWTQGSKEAVTSLLADVMQLGNSKVMQRVMGIAHDMEAVKQQEEEEEGRRQQKGAAGGKASAAADTAHAAVVMPGLWVDATAHRHDQQIAAAAAAPATGVAAATPAAVTGAATAVPTAAAAHAPAPARGGHAPKAAAGGTAARARQQHGGSTPPLRAVKGSSGAPPLAARGAEKSPAAERAKGSAG